MAHTYDSICSEQTGRRFTYWVILDRAQSRHSEAAGPRSLALPRRNLVFSNELGPMRKSLYVPGSPNCLGMSAHTVNFPVMTRRLPSFLIFLFCCFVSLKTTWLMLERTLHSWMQVELVLSYRQSIGSFLSMMSRKVNTSSLNSCSFIRFSNVRLARFGTEKFSGYLSTTKKQVSNS